MADDAPTRPVTHVGLMVSDIEAAIEWYEALLRFETTAGPLRQQAGDPAADRVMDLLGESFASMQVAFLETGGGTDLGLSEFDATSGHADGSPSNVGFFHVGVVDPGLETLASRIDETGGDHYADVWETYPGFHATYCFDPWRNRIEIYDREFDPAALQPADGDGSP